MTDAPEQLSLDITDPAPSLDEVLLTPKQLAARWGMTVASLSNMRGKGRGPRYRRFPNGHIRYPAWCVFNYEMGQTK